MFEHVAKAAPDPILGLTEAFKADKRTNKINLSVGVYKDANGGTPILESIKQAERALIEYELTKSYMPIDGSPAFGRCVQRLLLGKDHPLIAHNRCTASHTPGGTGALRVAGDLIHQQMPKATIHLTDPTWANHAGIFGAAGVPTGKLPWFDAQANSLNLPGFLDALPNTTPGDFVLLHGCCHNPTGVDPTPEQWEQIAKAIAEQQLIPVVDFAYQGFAEGIDEDATGLRTLLEHNDEAMVCSSFSKNFGLYCERVGALVIIAKTPDEVDAVQSNVKICIRRNYSNPPAHGAAIVSTVLNDEQLTNQWIEELATMRGRVNGIRKTFAEALDKRDVKLAADGNGFITRQNGMFSFSGLDPQQVAALREQHAIYIVGSGRINVAGITEDNVDQLADAIAEVM